MKCVLVAGFEPFAGDAINPSQEIARALDGRVIAERKVVGATLPCVFGDSRHELVRLLRAHEPGVAICLGLAGGRAAITPERVAINVDDARIADNAGRQPVDTPVVRSGPAAYWSRLPIKAIVAELGRRGIPASVSQTAGTFVCNHVFYALMHALRWQRTVRGGFIHVPFVPEQAKPGEPSLPLATMIAAIEIAIEVTLTTRRDVRLTGGQVG
ncbi:MAG TPA: pyroglutamyl-peptidase I [Opitutaceae bacterium]|nr:pyroglutamyl-peptidase I [Opitutaceae bacterium]